MYVLEALEDLEDVQLDFELGEVLHLVGLVLDHVFEVVLHVLEHDVLDELVLVVPRVVEVLVTGAYQDLDHVVAVLYVEQNLIFPAK